MGVWVPFNHWQGRGEKAFDAGRQHRLMMMQ